MSPDSEAKGWSSATELQGALKLQDVDSKLLHSVIEHDEKTVNTGKLVSQAINQGFSSFHPDLMFEGITKEYSMARNLYGESLLRLVTGHEPGYLKRNISIPEFQRELKQEMQKRFDELVREGFLARDGTFENKAYELASLILYTQELEHLMPKGFLGTRIHKKKAHYGEKEETRMFKQGDRYKDISLKKSITTAIRRGHPQLQEADLKIQERQSRGGIYIVYGMDASGSMRGRKIEMAKKAGIALAFHAINEKDHVGLLVFGSGIVEEIAPCLELGSILKAITKVRAQKETNFVRLIEKSIELFPRGNVTKHLVILSDALPTIGKDPEKETLEAVSKARSHGITVSMVGISLDRQGRALAEKIAQLGEGRLYSARDLEKLDTIILEDYYSVV